MQRVFSIQVSLFVVDYTTYVYPTWTVVQVLIKEYLFYYYLTIYLRTIINIFLTN